VSFIALILGIYQFKDLLLSDYPVLHNLITRILEPFDESDVLSDRGYQRIFDYPQYLLFGAGEGYSARIGGGIELHSLPGTVLFSYGIIGATIFIFLMIRIIFLMKFHVLLLLGVFLYNLSHNGLRFTILWVVIAIIIAFYEKENSAK